MKTITVGLGSLRAMFPNLKAKVQAGMLHVIVTENNRLLGHLVSPALPTIPSKSESVSSKYFRANLTDLKDELAAENLDCVFIQFHKRTKMAFVSDRFYKETARQHD